MRRRIDGVTLVILVVVCAVMGWRLHSAGQVDPRTVLREYSQGRAWVGLHQAAVAEEYDRRATSFLRLEMHRQAADDLAHFLASLLGPWDGDPRLA